VHSKNLSWRSSLSVERGCRGCVFQAIDDSIHHALLLMRLGFVFDFAYNKNTRSSKSLKTGAVPCFFTVFRRRPCLGHCNLQR
jgi:hypothetical protein